MIKITLLIILIVKTLNADPSFSIIPARDIENKEKYNLGKTLFSDPNLSKDKKISCASCHHLDQGGADNTPFSIGVYNSKGDINSPTIFNTKFNIAQDWIGISTSIKQRAKIAFLNKIEMNGNIKDLLIYISTDEKLSDQIQSIYKTINEDNIFDSIAYFVSKLTTPNSRFDIFLQGNNKILTNEEKKGYELFKSYGCVSCHNGVNIGGNMYQKYGIFNEEKINRDENQGRYTITKKEYDKNVLKVPSLRLSAKTGPYMHNGSINDLKDVIKQMGVYQLGINIPLKNIIKIEKFLNTLHPKDTSDY